MKCRPSALLLEVLAIVTAQGCVDSTKVGLSNARSQEWRQARTERSSDVIANSDDSCERPGSSTRDPAPVRLYPCPTKERQTRRAPNKP